MKDTHRIAALRQLCCLGVGGQASMPTLLKAVRELVPSDSAGFFWVNAAGDMTNLYAERVLPEAAANMFFERFHDGQDYSFKREFLQRASQADTTSAVEPTARFVNGDYYNTVMRALDAHFVMHGIVRDHGAALGQVSLYRSKDGKAFKTCERQRLADITHYLAHALAKPTEQRGEFVDTDDEGVVIVNSAGVVQQAAGHSRRLLLMATHPQHGALNRASLKSEIVETVMRDLIHRLQQTLALDAHSPPPKLVVANAWGRFALRAYYLSEAAEPGTSHIAVQIRRQEPMLLKLADGLRGLDLAPQLQQVALLLAQGQGNGDIAATLGVSENTVRWHVKQLFVKLGTHDRVDAINKLRPR
jgi:DNA-binding CsgD family transcriptional regulator